MIKPQWKSITNSKNGQKKNSVTFFFSNAIVLNPFRVLNGVFFPITYNCTNWSHFYDSIISIRSTLAETGGNLSS